MLLQKNHKKVTAEKTNLGRKEKIKNSISHRTRKREVIKLKRGDSSGGSGTRDELSEPY